MTSRPDSELAWIERTSVLENADPPWEALAALTAVRADTLCPLLLASPVPQGVALVHEVPAGSIALSELRAEGPLRAGHVLAVGLAVVEALVALHEAGLAHGGIRPDAVLVAPDGSVHLASCGAAWLRPPGDVDGPRPSDDVAAVGDLLRDALGAGPGHSGIVLVALRAGDPDPLLRPDADDLRAALQRCGRPDPLLDLLWRRSATPAATRARPVSRPGAQPDAPARPRPAVPPTTAPEVAVLRPSVTTRRRPSLARGPGAVAVALGSVAATALLVAGLRSQPGALAADLTPVPATSSSLGPAVSSPLPSSLVTSGPTPSPPVLSSDGSGSAMPGGAMPSGAAPGSISSGPTVAGPATSATAGPSAADPAAVPPVDLDRAAVAVDWSGLVAQLDEGRRTAIARGSRQALARWVDPGGPAWTADAALADRVRGLGAVLEGGELEVLEIRSEVVGRSAATLLVRDRRTAYSVVVDGSRTVVAAREARWWRVAVRLAGDRWRIWSATPATAPGDTPASGSG